MSEERADYGTAAVAVRHDAALSLKQIGDRVNLVHQVLEKVMRVGTHFGKVPGCGDKMVLLKPGADVLAMTFRLVPQFAVTRTDLENSHREYDVTCSMYGPDGALLGQGVGSASTMEKKYRYRKDAKGAKIENEDIADVYNTVLKIAKKRAHIDATLTVTGAADLFTQDLIDDDEQQKPPIAMPTGKPAAKPQDAPPAGNHDTAAHDIATGEVEQVSEKTGEKNGKAWTRYGIKVGGTFYNTFDTKLAEAARYAKDAGETVQVAYTTNAKGFHDAVDVAIVRGAAGAEPEQEELPI